MLDLQRALADTPAAADLAFFGSAGSSLQPRPVTEAVTRYLATEERIGGYGAAVAHAAELDAFYQHGAALVGADRSEIAFATSASDAWWRAFMSVELRPGDRVVTGVSEFAAGGIALIQARDRGVDIAVVGHLPDGTIDLRQLAVELEHPRTRLICLTHVAMANGAVQPAAAVGALARAAGVVYLLDGAQSVGQIDLAVDPLGCDFLIGTGRKFLRGPRGTAFLYVRASLLDSLVPPVFVDPRSGEWTDTWSYQPASGAQRFELGECNHAAKAGLATAMAYAREIGLANIESRIQMLADRLRHGLDALAGVTVRDRGEVRCGIVSFTVDGVDLTSAAERLQANGVIVNAPGVANARFDFDDRGIGQVLRAGVHYFNTDADLDRLLDEVDRLA